MPGLSHFVSLDGPAGVEMQFAEFVVVATRRHPEWTHVLVNPSRAIHPAVRRLLATSLQHEISAKYAGRLKLPAFPELIRAMHCRRALARAGTDVMMIWNRSSRIDFVIDTVGPERSIHFEHGAAWFPGRERERQRYFARVPRAIANSRAAARVLQLMWGFEGPIDVCRNGLRPSLAPAQRAVKPYPRERAVAIGVVARLYPVKAVAVAIHALRHLKDSSLDVEMHIAGDGPERARLDTLARALGVGDIVNFHGIVTSMESFYRRVDCLVHVPISEAFGLVAVEAAAHGCPVIAAGVDGLPEAVAEGRTGTCLRPELSLADYAGLGGGLEPLPERVYDPVADALAAPRIVAPQAIADAVVDLLASPARFEARSRDASATVAREYAFEPHVDAVMAAVVRHATAMGGHA